MEPVSEPGDPSPDVLRPSLFAAVLANARNAMAALLPFFLSSFLPSSFLQIVKKKKFAETAAAEMGGRIRNTAKKLFRRKKKLF